MRGTWSTGARSAQARCRWSGSSTDSGPAAFPWLVLWDVDGTLLAPGEGARTLYAAAFERFTGIPLRVRVDMAGRTDRHIFQATLNAHGLEPGDDAFGRFSALLAQVYSDGGDILRRQGRALPGAADALAALAARSGVVQSVLTGNIQPVAAAKLAAFGLERHLDLTVGAYGSDDALRANLVAIARRRAAAKYASAFPPAATLLVGDTPHDVAAARVAGVAVVAVATGRATSDELRAAGADVILPDLTDTEAFLQAALKGGGAEPTATSPTAG